MAATIAFITLNGALTRTQTIAQTIELGRDETLRTKSASINFFNPAAILLGTGCASATAAPARPPSQVPDGCFRVGPA